MSKNQFNKYSQNLSCMEYIEKSFASDLAITSLFYIMLNNNVYLYIKDDVNY